jgi:hypothetical protein
MFDRHTKLIWAPGIGMALAPPLSGRQQAFLAACTSIGAK